MDASFNHHGWLIVNNNDDVNLFLENMGFKPGSLQEGRNPTNGLTEWIPFNSFCML